MSCYTGVESDNWWHDRKKETKLIDTTKSFVASRSLTNVGKGIKIHIYLRRV